MGLEEERILVDNRVYSFTVTMVGKKKSAIPTFFRDLESILLRSIK